MAHKSTLQLNLAANVPASRQRRSYKLPLLHPTHRKCSLPDNNKYRSRKKPNRPWKYLDSRPTAAKTIEICVGCRILQRNRISKEIDEKFQLEPNDVRNILSAVLPSYLRLHDLSDRSSRPKTDNIKQPWLVQPNWVQFVQTHDLRHLPIISPLFCFRDAGTERWRNLWHYQSWVLCAYHLVRLGRLAAYRILFMDCAGVLGQKPSVTW